MNPDAVSGVLGVMRTHRRQVLGQLLPLAGLAAAAVLAVWWWPPSVGAGFAAVAIVLVTRAGYLIASDYRRVRRILVNALAEAAGLPGRGRRNPV